MYRRELNKKKKFSELVQGLSQVKSKLTAYIHN